MYGVAFSVVRRHMKTFQEHLKNRRFDASERFIREATLQLHGVVFGRELRLL
jgi:hypothetical protein